MNCHVLSTFTIETTKSEGFGIQRVIALTLIQPGEVKVDLANFYFSSGQNSYMSDFFKIDLFLQKRLANLSKLLKWRQKIMFWRPFWRFFIRSRAAETDCRPPPFRLVLLCIQTTRGREKSRQSVVRSPVQRQSTFQSVSGRGPCWVQGVAGSQSGLLSLSFLVYSWRRTVLGRFPKP
jgi:hypothetical protein